MTAKEEIHDIGRAGLEAALRKIDLQNALRVGKKQYAIAVVIREIPDAGMPINVATNVTSGKAHVLKLLDEARDVLRGGT